MTNATAIDREVTWERDEALDIDCPLCPCGEEILEFDSGTDTYRCPECARTFDAFYEEAEIIRGDIVEGTISAVFPDLASGAMQEAKS